MKVMEHNLAKQLGINILLLLMSLFGFFIISSDKYFTNLPINSGKLTQMKESLNTKGEEIKRMNEEIREIDQKKDQLRKNAEELSKNSLFLLNRGKSRVIDIPSILVYLEQIGSNAGLKVNSLEIVGTGTSGTSIPGDVKSFPVTATGSKQEIVISLTGSYKNFGRYLSEIQVNTRELIAVEGFRMSRSEDQDGVFDIELKISL